MGLKGTASTTGQSQPSTVGTDYGSSTVPQGGTELLIPSGVESGSYALRAHPDNNDIIFIGWDDDVDDVSGFPLEPGDVITVDLDNAQQNIYGYSTGQGNVTRHLAVG